MGDETNNYSSFRHDTPNNTLKYRDKYNFDGPELLNLSQQNPDVIFTQVLDLGTAQPVGQPLRLQQQGRAIVIYGFLSGNLYASGPNDTTGNTGIEQAEPSAFVSARINFNRAENTVSLKHSQGFIGSFQDLYLSWPAQTGVYARVYVFKYDAMPWQSIGDNRYGGLVEGTKIATQNVVSVDNIVITQIVGTNLARKVATITNLGSTNLFVGGNNVTIESGGTPGTLVQPNGIIYWRNSAPLFGISKTSPNNVSINEET